MAEPGDAPNDDPPLAASFFVRSRIDLPSPPGVLGGRRDSVWDRRPLPCQATAPPDDAVDARMRRLDLLAEAAVAIGLPATPRLVESRALSQLRVVAPATVVIHPEWFAFVELDDPSGDVPFLLLAHTAVHVRAGDLHRRWITPESREQRAEQWAAAGLATRTTDRRRAVRAFRRLASSFPLPGGLADSLRLEANLEAWQRAQRPGWPPSPGPKSKP